MVVGALYRALHAQAWKLADPSRDRDWPLQPPVPRKTQDRRYLHAAPPSQSLESQRQPRQDHHQVEVHKKAGTTEIKLLIQAVTVLERERHTKLLLGDFDFARQSSEPSLSF